MTAPVHTQARDVKPYIRNLGRLLSPKSIALVGASERSGWSGNVHNGVQVYDFPGNIYYVNPRGGTAHGQELWTSLSELPEVPDLVFIMVKATLVPGIIEEAGQLGVTAVEILSSGFSEVGAEGKALQDEVVRIAAQYDMAVLGPNNLGFANIHANVGLLPMDATTPLSAGPVAMISQSGNLAGQIQGLAKNFDIGVSVVVSTGNEAVVTAGDVIEYLIDHEPTQAIGVFLETVRRPDDFLAACRRAREAGKLVVVLKAGKSEAAARSALAHTGSLVGDDAVIDAKLRAAGVVRVDTLEDLIAVADTFTKVGPIQGPNVGLVSISGGAGDIASDLADPLGLKLPDATEETKRKLVEILPDYGTAQNPLDMTGAIVPQPHIFGQGLQALSEDGGFDIVLAVSEDEHRADSLDAPSLSGLLAAADASPVPALICTTTVRPLGPSAVALRKQRQMPNVSWGLDRTLTSIAAIYDWTTRPQAPESVEVEAVRTDDIGERTGTWSEGRSRQLFERAGVPVIPATIAASSADVPQLDEGVYAIKVLSDDLTHKSEVGGVRLNIAAADVAAEVDDVLATVAEKAPQAALDGVLISPMRSGGIELLVGVVNDAEWGKVLALGLGGIWAEMLKDVQRLALPASREAILQAFNSLRAAPLLHGARGTAPVDLDKLVTVVESVANLALSLGDDAAAIEVNPLRVEGSTVEALDAVVIWEN